MATLTLNNPTVNPTLNLLEVNGTKSVLVKNLKIYLPEAKAEFDQALLKYLT